MSTCAALQCESALDVISLGSSRVEPMHYEMQRQRLMTHATRYAWFLARLGETCNWSLLVS